MSTFCRYFNAVYICFVREGWHETRVRGVFPNGHSEKLTVSRLAIFDRSEVDLSLHQQSSICQTVSSLQEENRSCPLAL